MMINRPFPGILALERFFSLKLGTPIRLRIEDCRNPAPAEASWDLRRRVHETGRTTLGRMLVQARQGRVFQARRMKFPQHSYSISHCRETVFCALATDRRIHGLGVDLELDRAIPPTADRLYLSEREQRILEAGSAYSNTDLLRVWTVKEALFKADMENRRRGWLFSYECFDPCRISGRAWVRSKPAANRFRFASIPFRSGYLSLAVNDKRSIQ